MIPLQSAVCSCLPLLLKLMFVLSSFSFDWVLPLHNPTSSIIFLQLQPPSMMVCLLPSTSIRISIFQFTSICTSVVRIYASALDPPPRESFGPFFIWFFPSLCVSFASGMPICRREKKGGGMTEATGSHSNTCRPHQCWIASITASFFKPFFPFIFQRCLPSFESTPLHHHPCNW